MGGLLAAGRHSQLPELREMIEVLGNPNLERLSVRPEARFPLLDDLLETQKAGGLAALIAERSKKCFGG